MRYALAGLAIAAGLVLSIARCSGNSIPSAPAATSLEELLRLKPSGKFARVLLRDVSLDTAKQSWRVAGLEFYRKDPREVAEASGPEDLLSRRESLAGGFVRLKEVPKPLFHFFEKGRRPGRAESFDIPTQLYAPVLGFEDRLWIVSEVVKSAEDPKAAEFIERTDHIGLLDSLWEARDSSLIGAAYRKSPFAAVKPLKPETLALLTQPPPAESAPVACWLPVEASAYRFWVVSLGGRPFPGGSIDGILDWVRDPTLDEFASRLEGQGVDYKARGVVTVGSASEFRRSRGLSLVHGTGLLLLAAGVLASLGPLLLPRD